MAESTDSGRLFQREGAHELKAPSLWNNLTGPPNVVCDMPLDGDCFHSHCHITGKYRDAAQNACDLKLRLNPKTTTIPVMFHNLRGYDSHLLMQAISKVEGHITCIPNNTEKYISFSLGQLRFIDSTQFLLASLDQLIKANNPELFQIAAQYEPNQQRRELLMQKGIYPYEYMDSWDHFSELNYHQRKTSTGTFRHTHQR